MQYYVRTLRGININVEIDENTTVRDLKEIIHDKNHIPVQDQRLIFAGKQLQDHLLLMRDLQVQNECGMHLVVRDRDLGECTSNDYDFFLVVQNMDNGTDLTDAKHHTFGFDKAIQVDPHNFSQENFDLIYREFQNREQKNRSNQINNPRYNFSATLGLIAIPKRIFREQLVVKSPYENSNLISLVTAPGPEDDQNITVPYHDMASILASGQRIMSRVPNHEDPAFMIGRFRNLVIAKQHAERELTRQREADERAERQQRTYGVLISHLRATLEDEIEDLEIGSEDWNDFIGHVANLPRLPEQNNEFYGSLNLVKIALERPETVLRELENNNAGKVEAAEVARNTLSAWVQEKRALALRPKNVDEGANKATTVQNSNIRAQDIKQQAEPEVEKSSSTSSSSSEKVELAQKPKTALEGDKPRSKANSLSEKDKLPKQPKTKAQDDKSTSKTLDENSVVVVDSASSVEKENEPENEKTSSAILEQILFNDLTVPAGSKKEKALAIKIATHWSARFSTPPSSMDLKKSMPHFVENYLDPLDIKPKLNVENLSTESKAAFQTILAYAAKLSSEVKRAEGIPRQAKLENKLKALGGFIKSILEQDDLTEKSLMKAYNAFERLDENTGSGAFRVYAFFKNMRYTDKDNKSRLVHSTLGQLVFDLKKQLVDDLKNPKAASDAAVEDVSQKHDR